MANAEHYVIFKQGPEHWNKWRRLNPQISPDLDDITLNRTDLSGYDLSCTSLKRVNLANAVVTPHQFAGADLTGAELPEFIKPTFEQLDVAKEISGNAQNLFLAVLAACLYCWLTIASTTDVNLITNRASSPLPIIQTSIPIVGFYLVAPLLLLGAFLYLHFYLQKLWDEMGSLPAIFPDGRPLQDKADPWLLSDLVRSHVLRLRPNRPFLSHLQAWLSIALAWWAVPITLVLFWARYLRRHVLWETTVHCVLTAIAITGAIFLYRLATATLRGELRRPLRWRLRWWKGPAGGPLIVCLASAAILIFLSTSAIYGARTGVAGRDWWPASAHNARDWVPSALQAAGASPFAELRGADLSGLKQKTGAPSNEKEKDAPSSEKKKEDTGKDDDKPNSLQGLQLSGTDLRYADLRGASLQGTLLTDSHLEWADLLAANLTASELAGAHLEQSDLMGAHLNNADLSGAHLNGANLIETDLTHAELQFADLQEVKGLSLEKLKTASNWCNAFLSADVSNALQLPKNNNDRVRNWRAAKQAAIQENRDAAEAARVEELSRLFPGMNSELSTLQARVSDPTLDSRNVESEAEQEQDLVKQAAELAPIPWPSHEGPVAAPINPAPSPDSPLPASDYLVITWTVAEARALAAVFTPENDFRTWYGYKRFFDSKFKGQFSERSPAASSHLLGHYFPVRIRNKQVLLFKSELHLVTDGPSLPLETLLEQIMQETGAKLVITTGTAGSVGRGLQVGDVVVASTSLFHCRGICEQFNGEYVSNAEIPAAKLEFANKNLFKANAVHLEKARTGVPQVYWNNTPYPNVVITTDYFVSDDTSNSSELQCLGSVIEEDDAVLGLACSKMKPAPQWLSVRNVSLPQQSSRESRQRLQAAAALYKRYGFWTTIQSAIATWAIIDGTP